MRLRNGFVSNSSSSSFICAVCSQEASGWDLGLEGAGMFQCVNGHTVCVDHAKKDLPDDTYEVASKFCPICTFDKVIDEDMVPYLLKKFNTTKEELEQEIRDSFKSYVKLKKHLDKK